MRELLLNEPFVSNVRPMPDDPTTIERNPTRLLVSVRSAVEAHAAIEGGAALIDVKEPAAGALGAAAPWVVADVVSAVAGRMPVSAALGELTDWPGSGWARSDWRHWPVWSAAERPKLVKMGLAGCASDPSWPARWAAALADRPVDWAPVAVVYADWEQAGAPAPAEVHRHAAELGCRATLIDTYDKSRGRLPDLWPLDQLRPFLQRVRRSGQMIVLGGSLTADVIPDILPLQPDYIAVRGAACKGYRTGSISADRVHDLVAAIDQPRGYPGSLSPGPR